MQYHALHRLKSVVQFFLIIGLIMSFNQIHAQNKPQQKRIAILELANRTKHQVSLDEINFLTNEMRQVAGYLPSSEFLVMTKESIEVLIDPSKSLEDCVGTCEVETGRLLGADWILTGEVIRFGKSLRVSIKLHETQSGQYLAGESLKGKEVEDLELPIQQSTLKLVYRISPTLENTISQKAGPRIEKQLECLKQSSACRTSTPSSPPASTQPSVKTKTLKERVVNSLLSTSSSTTSSSSSTFTYKPQSDQLEYESDSQSSLVVDGFGFLLFGPSVTLELGKHSPLRFMGRWMKLGALTSVILAGESGESFEFGASVGVGYRKFNDRKNARRGLYWGFDVEYMVLETQYEENGSMFATDSTALTGILHFGYRWVSDNMLIGDLFGLGLWLAYAQPLSIEHRLFDSYDWPSSYLEKDFDSQIYGGIAMDLGWML